MSTPTPAPGPSLRGAVDLSALVNRANAPAGGAPQGETPAGRIVVETGDAGFEAILDLSNTVPVIVEFYAAGIEPALEPTIRSYGGRLVLATVDGSRNPQLAQAFQVREVPTVAAVIGGRPLSLFVGIPEDGELRQVLDQVLQLAAQNGVTGSVPVDGADGEEGAEPAEPVEEPLPPHHQEAYDAIARGDYAAAQAEYRLAIAQNPRDAQAVAGLAQVSLLARLDGADAAAVRSAAAERPQDVDAQLAVADLDMSGGHLEDAVGRLLDLFLALDQAGRDAVRARVLEFFEIAGADDPRVGPARARLASLLY
jgi:putative thioredoxin